MKNIQALHEEIFTFLNNWNEQSRSRNSEINPYFYMRSVRDERFKKGYWFPGTDSYIHISFWSGGDSTNKTPNIYIEFSNRFGCRVIVTSQDSESKYEYFAKMINELNAYEPQKHGRSKKKMWIKPLQNNLENWKDVLEEFMITDKRRIDNYVDINKLTEFEEFVSKFGFINVKDFEKMYSRILKERDRIKEAEYNKHQAFLDKPKLPFALLGISVENFQGIKSADVGEINPDARWIFITGENGYGKTTLLQAVALGLSGDPELEKYLDSNSRISIELVNQNEKAFPVRTKGNISTLESADYGQFVLGYGPARLNVQSTTSENKEERGRNNVLSLFDNETLLKNLNYELFASNYSEPSTFNELEDLIKKVTKGRINRIEIKDREALFVETLSNGDVLEPMPLSKLAAGFRSIINIVIDIYLKFKKVHPDKLYADFYGIVLIDEIENHLHPILQRELPKALSDVFPQVQFIISTHSPIPLIGAESNSIILKVNRGKNEGVTIERLDETVDLANLLPNTILTSPIFGFQDIFSESKEDNDFVRVETTYADVQNNDEQASRIARYLDKETTAEILNLLKK